MLDNYDIPLVFDATHSVQKPSALGKSSGGNRDYVAGLTRSASALGVNNFFLEVHKDPPSAPSDGANMVYLKNFKDIVYDIYRYSYSL
jgi:2-dehydro-3-deoxyphosphooctonate aldolase (KDO 8-P synthase)